MTNIDIALNYLIKNKLVPLPCMGKGESIGKTPLIKWEKIQELPTPDQVREWFKNFPNANIGFKTGKVSSILVLDNDGVEITEPMPLTTTATSRLGHFHSYFKNPDFYVPPSASKIGEHLDIRCDQAFIVAPPSKHFNKETGEIDGDYQWIDGMSPDDLPFAPCPEWLIAKIKESLNTTHGYDWSTALNVGVGARDDTLKSAAASLIAKGFEYETALAILRGINNTYNPPLEDDVVVNKLETAIEFIGSKKEQEQSFLIGEPISWADITEEDNIKDWIWENYIARGNITLLSALWKAGKSTFLRCLFQAMAHAEEFAGQPTKKCKVLVISEEARGEWADKKEDVEVEDIRPIIIWPRPIRVKPNLKQWIQFIEEITARCKAENIEMVVIDTLSTFWPIDNENDSAQVLKALVPLYSFSENNIATLLVHHFRKGGGDQAQASRGSGALPGFVDNIIEFTRNEDGFLTQRILKTYGRFDAVIPRVVIDLTLEGKYKTLGEPYEVSKSARLEKIVSIFRESKEALSVKEVFNFWSSTGPDVTLRSVQSYIKELIFKNILSLVETRLVIKKLIPFYALTGEFTKQTKIGDPLPSVPFVSSVNASENDIGSFSSVTPKNVPPADETKGTSVSDRDIFASTDLGKW